MRAFQSLLPVLGLVLFVSTSPADDAAAITSRQKARAHANWKQLFDAQAPVEVESKHFLLLAPPPWTLAQLKTVAANLEQILTVARKPLEIDAKDDVWPGRLAVYLLDEPVQLHMFMLAVAKKRPDEDSLGVFNLRSDYPFVGAAAGTQKYEPSAAQQAGEQLAAAILTSKVGRDLPDWVVSGFGRATVWRATPNSASTRAQRKQVHRLVAMGRTAGEIWSGKLPAAEAGVLQASLMEALAYGIGPPKFTAFAEGFKPERRGQQKTAADAFRAAGLQPQGVAQIWRHWVKRH